MSEGEITTRFKSHPLSWMDEKHVHFFQYYREDFSGLTIEGKDFMSGDFIECDFSNTKFVDCNLEIISFVACNINRLSFDSRSTLTMTSFNSESPTKKLQLTQI